MEIKIETIIFDLDGVLINSGEDIANAVIHAIKELNAPMHTKREIISYIGSGVEQLIRKSFDKSDEETIKKAIGIYRKYYVEHCTENTVLYPHVKEILNYFKEKNIAVLTNKPEEQAKQILDEFGVLKYIKTVFGPESVTNMKPSPDGVFKILQGFKTDPGFAIIIGDSDTDVIAGKNGGIHTCGVTFGLGSLNNLRETDPEILINDLIELKDSII